MAMKYGSMEWLNALKEKSQTDQEYLKKAKRLTMKWQDVVTDAPGGVDLLVEWEVKEGKLVSVKREEKKAPSDFREFPFDEKEYLARFMTSYETSCKLHKKEMTVVTALMSGRYKIRGPLPKIMALMPELTAFGDLAASIPCEY